MEHNERIDSAAGEPVSACKRRKHLRLAALAVSCALLGVMVGTVYSTNTARSGRVQVRDVTEDSAGAHAGLREGDFITALDDYTVRTLSDLSAALRHYRGGQHATLTIERYGKTFRLPIVFDSKDDAVQNEEPTTSANALEPSEQDSPRP